MLAVAATCPTCQAKLPPDAPDGLCPRCLVKQALGSGVGHSALAETSGILPISSEVPTVAEVAPLVPQLEVLELIGQGGMGVVYLARQPGLDRRVALKLLSPRFASEPSFAERFAREARSLARLSHPNVVGVHDSGRTGDHYYFVMEYVEGTSLRELLQGEPLEPAHALELIVQVCRGLQYAHDQGVVHRDIKPENILVGEDGRARLADFGLAKLVRTDEGREPSLTLTRQVMGTPHYMAPEQVRPSGAVDTRADVYSVGVVLYELLTGRLPLGRFPAPSELGRGDAALDAVVLRSLEQDPERRHARVRDLERALEDVQAGRFAPEVRALPISITPAAPVARRPQLSPPERLCNFSLMFLLVALLFGLVAAVVYAVPFVEPGQPGDELPGLLARLLGGAGGLALLASAVLGRLADWEARRRIDPLYGLRRVQALAGPALLSGALFAALLVTPAVVAALNTEPNRRGVVLPIMALKACLVLAFTCGLAGLWVYTCPELVRRLFFPLFQHADPQPLWMASLTAMAGLVLFMFMGLG